MIDAAVPMAEDGPVNILMIPAKSANKKDAHRLLAFMSQPEINGELAKGWGQLPSNNKAPETAGSDLEDRLSDPVEHTRRRCAIL